MASAWKIAKKALAQNYEMLFSLTQIALCLSFIDIFHYPCHFGQNWKKPRERNFLGGTNQIAVNSAADPRGQAGPNRNPVTLGDLETALIAATECYHHWMMRGMEVAGEPGLSPLEAKFLNILYQQADIPTFTELCRKSHVQEPHLAHYALRKLRKLGLISTGRRGKEKTIALTERGRDISQNFSDIRTRLIGSSLHERISGDQLKRTSAALKELAQIYQNAKSAAETW